MKFKPVASIINGIIQTETRRFYSYSPDLPGLIVNGIFGEESQILTNQKRENSAVSLLIGCNLGPFPEYIELYFHSSLES